MAPNADGIMARDLVVIGASAGGVQALESVAAALPADFPAAVMVVIHVPAEPPSVMPAIIARAGPLPARHAADGEPIEIGTIYVAPPDRHLMVEPGRLRVVHGPRENGHRPAVDALFRSAARAYGPQVIGVVLTGNLDDGTAGLRAVKERGGVAIVQDPADAFAPGMPRSALAAVAVDHCLPLEQIPPLLRRLLELPLDPAAVEKVRGPNGGPQREDDRPMKGELSTHFSCPECRGVLYQLRDGEQFRCRVGHRYSPEALLDAQGGALEAALWASVRSLEERATLARRIGNRLGHRQMKRFESRARESEAHAAAVRQMLTGDAEESRD